VLHMFLSRSDMNISSAKTNHSPSSRNMNAVLVGGGIHERSIALNLAKRGIDCVALEKDYVARHASEVNGGGVRTLGGDIPAVPPALRPLKPVALGALVAIDTVDAAS